MVSIKPGKDLKLKSLIGTVVPQKIAIIFINNKMDEIRLKTFNLIIF